MRGYSPVSTSPSGPHEKPRIRSISNLWAQRPRRPLIVLLIVSTPAVLFIAWLAHSGSYSDLWSSYDNYEADGDGWTVVSRINKERGLRRLSWGALSQQGAKKSIRKNLKDDRGYLFSMYGAGWNNQVFQMINLIYLAHLSERTPILPSFRWNMQLHSPDVAVSDIFDLSQVSSSLDNMAIVEMHEVKGTTTLPDRLKVVEFDGEFVQYKRDGSEWQTGQQMYAEKMESEQIGCWSMYGSRGEVPAQNEVFAMDTPYTPLPRSMYNWKDDPGRPAFVPVGQLLRPRHPSADEHPPVASVEILRDHSMADPAVWPDTHIACIDTTFGFSEQISRYDVGGEYRSGTGAWAAVGNRLRFSAGIERLGNMYLREVFGLGRSQVIPAYIAVHIRRGDFGDAFLALSQRQYAHAAWLVKESLRIKHGLDVAHVLATSDETDPTWTSDLERYGFTFVNHTRLQTVERFGPWFPTVLDSYMLSTGKGFLGVIYSTMSILAYRRTIDWNQGVARMIELDHFVPNDWVWS